MRLLKVEVLEQITQVEESRMNQRLLSTMYYYREDGVVKLEGAVREHVSDRPREWSQVDSCKQRHYHGLQKTLSSADSHCV